MSIAASDLPARKVNLSDSKRELLERRLRGIAKPADPPAGIPRRATPERAPLSSAQERMWFFNELQPDSAAYNMAYAFRLRGALHATALQLALSSLAARHEILRTRFVKEDGVPVQVISPAQPLPVREADLSAAPSEQRLAALEQRLAEEFARPFHLAEDLMLRAALFRLGAEDYVLAITIHHIASDLWSSEILFRELSELYAGFASGADAALPPLPIQYGDFAAWEQSWLGGAEPAKSLDYWKQKLAGAPALLELPTDRPRPATQTFRGGIATLSLAPVVNEAIQQLSRAENVTPFMALLAVFQVLLSRRSRQTDIVVGIPTAGRTQEQTAASLGLFVNTLALRSDLSTAPSFRELLQQVRTTTLEALYHQEVPFNHLVRALHPVRDSGYSPLVQVMFTLQKAATASAQFAGLQTTAIDTDTRTSRFDLTLIAEETGSALTLFLEYNSDLFDAATAERTLAEFSTLVESALARPDQSVAALPILPPAESRQLLADWNQTQRSYPDQPLLHDLFEAQAQRTPQATALVAGRQRLTYQALHEQAERVAIRLRTLGVGAEVRVALFLERTADLVIAMLGVLKAGGAYVAMDPAYPPERLAFIVQDSQATVVLTQSRLRASVPPTSAQILCVDDRAGWSATSGRAAPLTAGVPTTPANLAYVIYTSGSTGRPKGVGIEHRNSVNFVRWAHTVFSPRELNGVFFSTSICFDLSIFELFVPLTCGGKVVLGENGLALADHPSAAEVHLINTVPAVMNELIRLGKVPDSLETVNLGGEYVPQELVDKLHTLPQVKKIYDLYGPTETATYSTYVQRRAHVKPTIGRPLSNTTIYILDHLFQPVPIGVTGELYIGGAGVARGYLDRPELNAERFIPDPFSDQPGARLYRTGDNARYRPDGQIEYLGRADQQVKIRGFRIELGEIEAALRAHPAVAEAAVTAREHAGERRLVAYIVPQPGHTAPGEWRSFLQRTLPDPMIPAVLMVLAAMPRTANGKIERKALPEPELSLAAGTGRPEFAPRDELERQLTAIWETVLGMTGIGVTDQFFDLGGHSLLAVRLASQVEKALNVKLPVAALFRAPTVEQLACLIREAHQPTAESALLAIQPHGSKPPLFLVHGMGGGLMWGFANLARYCGDDQPVYAFKASEPDELGEAPTIEQMAAHYLAAMRRFQPQGPYRLGGYCFGGNVAYEMARMLEAQGERPSLLVLMNAWPANSGGDTLPVRPMPLLKFLLNLCHWSSRLYQWKPGARSQFFRWKFGTIKQRVARWFGIGVPPADGDVALFVDLSAVPWSERKLWAAHLEALNRYRPQSYGGKITLLRTRGYPLFCSFEYDHGWKDFAPGGVNVHIVPGTHETLMVEPHVAPLARELKRHLTAAAAGQPHPARIPG
jgi:amino acid adenylation domain-containing protein